MKSVMSLRRWETYCILAIASVAWLLLVSVRVYHNNMQRIAEAERRREDGAFEPASPWAKSRHHISATSAMSSAAGGRNESHFETLGLIEDTSAQDVRPPLAPKAGPQEITKRPIPGALVLAAPAPVVSQPVPAASQPVEGSGAPRLVSIAPIPRVQEPEWMRRHQATVKKLRSGTYDVMLLGDSITQGWEVNQNVWRQRFPRARVINAGIASDRVEHILWRVEHGLFAGHRPKVVVLMAGINNLALAPSEKIAGGVYQIVAAIHRLSPSTRILVQGILPSGEEASNPRRDKISRTNALIARLADGRDVRFVDFGRTFLSDQGAFTRAVSFDGVHLTREGYGIWAQDLEPVLKSMLPKVGRLVAKSHSFKIGRR